MTILELNVVDGVAISEDGKTCILLLIDPLLWKPETHLEHLTLLQEKINNYLTFIEYNQYVETFEAVQVERFTIDIKFAYEPPAIATEFLAQVQHQLEEYQITLCYEHE